MQWQVVLGVAGLLIAFGLFVWYKFEQGLKVKAQLVQAEVAKGDALEVAKKAEAQIVAKNEQERQALNEEITNVMGIDDVAVRQRMALDLLFRLRGVH